MEVNLNPCAVSCCCCHYVSHFIWGCIIYHKALHYCWNTKYLLPDHIRWTFNVEAAVRWGPSSSTCWAAVWEPWRHEGGGLSWALISMESGGCVQSLWCLCVAVVCRQRGTHGTLMAMRARCRFLPPFSDFSFLSSLALSIDVVTPPSLLPLFPQASVQ